MEKKIINAGAMVIADILVTHLKNPKKDFIAFVRNLSNNPGIQLLDTRLQLFL